VAIEELRITHAFRAFADKPEINLRSVQQLSKLFFEELGWPTRDDFRTENGAPQINEAALNWYIEEFDFTLAHLKLRFNEIATLRGTFLEGLINGVSEDGRMRSDFKQVGPNTGRIASRKKTVEVTETYTTKRGVEKERVRKEKQGANLQNIPTSRTDPYGIRGAFIAPAKGEFTADGTRAEEDYTLIVSDYTGFELYMAIYNAARFSPDSEMLTYARKGANLHAITAYRMGLIPREKRADVEAMIRDEEWSKLKKLVSAIESGRIYNSGKVCNFQLLYGGQAKLLCKKFGWDWRDRVNLRKADALIRAWGESWPEMPLYQKGIVAFGYQHGYVPTLAGARVHVREGLLHPDDGMRMHWERKCMNSPCQRSSAEIVKAAMILIDQDEELWELGARQLVQVHDEIVNEAPLRTAEPSQERIEHLMKNNRLSEKLGFPLVVEGKRAKSWLEAK
jgi:DNA polymerase-1